MKNMKISQITELTQKQLIRIAELAFGYKIRNPYVYYQAEEKVYYVFDGKGFLYDDFFFRVGGFHYVEPRFDYCEVDSSWNINLKHGSVCNMLLIYTLILSWGVIPNYSGTGLFPKSKYVPLNLSDLENYPSEN